MMSFSVFAPEVPFGHPDVAYDGIIKPPSRNESESRQGSLPWLKNGLKSVGHRPASQRLELAMPPTITFEEAKGFNLYMLRTVMNGRDDELIDLAKTNLFH
jgi:hypothetical protein